MPIKDQVAERARIDRIRRMERCLDKSGKAFDKMAKALAEYEAVQSDFKRLCDYYQGPKWMEDFEADEQKKLPENLKRGVLSEDAVYDLLTRNHELTSRMLKIIAKNVEEHRG
ncbi:MAG: DUF4298 domain-containing protein [Clostridia bacterium]|nr:DUF4298 domain-containing protein [Clostridia bacterium]